MSNDDEIQESGKIRVGGDKTAMKKFISVVLVAVLLMGSLAGCSSKKPAGTDISGTSAGNNINAKPPKTGPVGQWDIPIPEINPLGSQALYAKTDRKSVV